MMQAGTTKGAAELIGMSQPAVSRLIDAFEKSVAIPLFERTRNRLSPTPEALLLYEAVERTFSSVDRIRELAADIRSADAGALTIAVLPVLAFELLPGVLESFKARHPRTTVSVQILPSPKIEELAASQQIDFGLAVEPFSRTGIQIEPFCRAPFVLAVPREHPHACKAQVSPSDCADLDFIALPATSLRCRHLDQAFCPSRADPLPLP